MYTSKQITLAILLAAVTSLVIGGALVASTNTAQAQSKKLTCDTTKDCNIIIRRLKVGDDLIIQFKATPPSSGGGGGGGTVVGTVDQQARDDIANLKTTDAAQDNNIARLESANTELSNQVAAVQGENAALKQNLSAVNDAMILQTQAIQELQTAVKNITDANPFVDLNVTGNQSQGEPQPLPPQGNETAGNGENQTTTPPVAGNESGTVPPSNETTTNPPVGNESVPIVTHPIQCADNEFYNATSGRCEANPSSPSNPVEGNVTVPIEGNVTIPGNITTGAGGESNVTLPIDNSSGNIIVENGTAGVVENGTLANSSNGTVTGDIVGFRANN